MNVRPFKNETLRYQVESESGEPPFFVDLMEFEGFGLCDCKDFMCWSYPFLSGTKTLEQTIADLPPARRAMWKPGCKHLVATKLYFAESALKEIFNIQMKHTTCKSTNI